MLPCPGYCGHLGCFHVLAIVNSAVNIGVHVSLSILVSSVCMPNSGIGGSYSSSWRRKWQPTPVLLPGKSHGRRSLVGYSLWGHEESDTTERLHFTSLHWSCKLSSASFQLLKHTKLLLTLKFSPCIGGSLLPNVLFPELCWKLVSF